MKRTITLLAAILSAACSGEDKMLDQAAIYYVPIGVATYVPMTPKNIQESAVSTGLVVVSDQRFELLIDLFEASPAGTFENDDLRAKIVLPDNKVIYVDNSGGIQLPSLQNRKLSRADLVAVRQILENITK